MGCDMEEKGDRTKKGREKVKGIRGRKDGAD